MTSGESLKFINESIIFVIHVDYDRMHRILLIKPVKMQSIFIGITKNRNKLPLNIQSTPTDRHRQSLHLRLQEQATLAEQYFAK